MTKLGQTKENPPVRPARRPAWKVIIADDEPDIHIITKMTLRDFVFDGSKLEIFSAYTAQEAFAVVKKHPDAAIILLDVVMESDHAGLRLVRSIREELGNEKIRIILRTGQPGKAPEADIIARYDINDYRLKTDLTASRLSTLIYSCLRSYRDIATIEESKQTLERMIDASASIFQRRSTAGFAEEVLDQFARLLSDRRNAMGGAALKRRTSRVAALAATGRNSDQLVVVAATGGFGGAVGRPLFDLLAPEAAASVHRLLGQGGGDVIEGDRYVCVRNSPAMSEVVVVEGCAGVGDVDRGLLDLFGRNVGIGFENLKLKEDISETQRQIGYRLGSAVEFRSTETRNHIRRVAEMSGLLARASGMAEQDAEILQHASPLHDVGKICIPDAILNKPGKHTAEEWEIMKSHAPRGYELLAGSDQETLQVGAIIALEHHERWDGGGYPFGKRGEEIGIHGRIVAAADAFDALLGRRCYKEPWPIERVLDLFRTERGGQFEPRIVDLILERIDDLLAIQARFPD